MSSLISQARRALLGLTGAEKSLVEHFGSPDQAEVLAQHAQATQAIHARVATQPPGPLSTGARTSGPAPATTLDLHCWAKFAPAGLYTGEYGFDWVEWTRAMLGFKNWLPGQEFGTRAGAEITKVMGVPVGNLEYCYDSHQQRYLPVKQDAHLKTKLQNEYPRLSVYGEDYFVGWLSLRPGQEIQLFLYSESLNAAPLKGDYLTFEAHASYHVTVGEQVNEAIRIPLQAGSTEDNPTLLTIKCVRACTDTALRVRDEKGVVVGQLNVVDNTKTYVLPIRLVYLVKEGPAMATTLHNLQATVTPNFLTTYLNTKSLNQAQIQVAFENTNKVHTVAFKEAEWNGKYYDAAHNWLTDYNNAALGEPKLLLDKVLADYSAKYETKGHPAFRGVLLLISNLSRNPADNQGGVSKIRPVNFRGAFVYGENLANSQTFAHEIGHALGLDHSFYNAGLNEEVAYEQKLTALEEKFVVDNERAKQGYEATLASQQKAIDQLRADQKLHATYYAQHPEAKRASEAALQKQLAAQQTTKQVLLSNDKSTATYRKDAAEGRKDLATYRVNVLKFKQYTTKNIMDYIQGNQWLNDPRCAYFHWQWKILQNDVRTYYGQVK